jgi:fatty acid desaturase/predicted heme/steroid binding protein
MVTASDAVVRRQFTLKEVAEHKGIGDSWIVIHGKVYDISKWVFKHPGGKRLISSWAGEDATCSFMAFHPNRAFVEKYLIPLYIGDVKSTTDQEEKKHSEMSADYKQLFESAEKRNLFKPNMWFYLAHLFHIIFLDQLAWILLWYFNANWWSYMLAVALAVTAQAQAGWLQHDFGHLSVFPKNTPLNHLAHKFVICHLKAASSSWWNYRHFRHHAKPNIIRKDPDIEAPYLFLMGNVRAREWGKRKKGFMPYQHQHQYWFLTFPPLLLPVYFHYDVLRFLWRTRDWIDFLWVMSFFVRWSFQYVPILGWSGALTFYMVVRFFESHWFTWVTQMSHVPMDIDHDHNKHWISLQLDSTCNVEQSFFNDWFTGHLNFQIEHHLFPTMPRHHYAAIASEVRVLCEKYNLKYSEKDLWNAFADVVRSLKKSGSIYVDAYNHS